MLAALLLVLGATGAGAYSELRCPEADRAPSEATLHFERSSMLCLVNRARERLGLPRLHFSLQLRRAATEHSQEMVARHYFSHDGLDGTTPSARIASTGYLSGASSYFVGENLGGGMGRGFGSAWAVYRAWMDSPPHRANLLDPRFRQFGVGVARGFPYARGANWATYTLDLATRR